MLSHLESPLDVNKQQYMIKATYIKGFRIFRMAGIAAASRESPVPRLWLFYELLATLCTQATPERMHFLSFLFPQT